MSTVPRRLLSAAALATVVVSLTGCRGATVPMQPAPDAANPLCAEVSVRLPSAVDGLPVRATDAQATGAWGEPAMVLLRCGVTSPGPTTAECVDLDGIDWIVDRSLEAQSIYTFTTFGRSPAVEVTVDASGDSPVSGTGALIDLKDAVGRLPQTSKCLGADDVLGAGVGPSSASTPGAPGGTAVATLEPVPSASTAP